MQQKLKRFLSILLCVLLIGSVAPMCLAAEGDGVIYISDLTPTSWRMYASSSDNAASPYHPSYDTSEDGSPLVIAGVTYAKGVRTHPDGSYPADMVYDVSGKNCNTFAAVVGKDAVGATDTKVQFVVIGDEKVKFRVYKRESGYTVYLLNTDFDCSHEVKVNASGKQKSEVIDPAGLKRVDF